jgi:hypothetical protein
MEEKKSCYEIECEIRATIDLTLYKQMYDDWYIRPYGFIQFWKGEHQGSLNIGLGNNWWEFDFEENIAISHRGEKKMSHAEGLVEVLACINSTQTALRQ